MLVDFHRHPREVAPDILGWTIVCRGSAAVLTELEAYHEDEPAAHSFGGRPTPRTRDLFGPAGTAYVYFTYGMHWCANIVTGPEGSGQGMLMRAGVPVHGEEAILARRLSGRVVAASLRPRDLLSGPARLAQGLGITGADSGRAIVRPEVRTLDAALEASLDGPVVYRDTQLAAGAGIELPAPVIAGPRIGITRAIDLPWRFGARGATHSRPFPATQTPADERGGA